VWRAHWASGPRRKSKRRTCLSLHFFLAGPLCASGRTTTVYVLADENSRSGNAILVCPGKTLRSSLGVCGGISRRAVSKGKWWL
jgi:hypothetical protein